MGNSTAHLQLHHPDAMISYTSLSSSSNFHGVSHFDIPLSPPPSFFHTFGPSRIVPIQANYSLSPGKSDSLQYGPYLAETGHKGMVNGEA